MLNKKEEFIITQLLKTVYLKIGITLEIKPRENPKIILSFKNLIKEVTRIEVVESKIKKGIHHKMDSNINLRLIQKIVVKIENNYNRLLKKSLKGVLAQENYLKKNKKSKKKSLQYLSLTVNIFQNLLLQLHNHKLLDQQK